MEEVEQLRRREGAQRGAAIAAQFLRQGLRGLAAQPEAQFPERGVEDRAQRQRGRGSGSRFLALPDDVQDDVLEGGVTVMAVGAPAAGTEINLDVAGLGRVVAKLDERAAEIGAALHAAETGMKDADGLTVQGLKLFAEQALVLPDGLQEAFGRRVPVVAQDGDDPATDAPLGIEAGQDRRHRGIVLGAKRVGCQEWAGAGSPKAEGRGPKEGRSSSALRKAATADEKSEVRRKRRWAPAVVAR